MATTEGLSTQREKKKYATVTEKTNVKFCPRKEKKKKTATLDFLPRAAAYSRARTLKRIVNI